MFLKLKPKRFQCVVQLDIDRVPTAKCVFFFGMTWYCVFLLYCYFCEGVLHQNRLTHKKINVVILAEKSEIVNKCHYPLSWKAFAY